jgi:hypothetical protein
MTTSGAKALSRVYLAPQAAFGTAVAAQTAWRGIAQFPKDARGKEMPEENIGYTSKTSRQHDLFHLAEMEFPETTATYEQILHLFEAGIQTVTPSADGSGTDSIFSYVMATGDANTIAYYTIEGGNNKNAEEMQDALVREFTLAGRKKEAWKMSAVWDGTQTTDTTFTAGISVMPVNAIKFQKTKLYIDNVSGTIGTTQIANSFLDFSLKYTTGWYLSHTGDGDMTPSFAEYVGATATLSMTLLHNAATKAERDLWKANTPRQIRIQAVGETAFGSAGTAYSYPTINLDMAGVYTVFDAPNEDDEGASVYKVEFEVGYDTTAALGFEALVAAELSGLIPSASVSPSASLSPSASASPST